MADISITQPIALKQHYDSEMNKFSEFTLHLL